MIFSHVLYQLSYPATGWVRLTERRGALPGRKAPQSAPYRSHARRAGQHGPAWPSSPELPRRADVAVGGAEESRHAEHPVQALALSALAPCHGLETAAHE